VPNSPESARYTKGLFGKHRARNGVGWLPIAAEMRPDGSGPEWEDVAGGRGCLDVRTGHVLRLRRTIRTPGRPRISSRQGRGENGGREQARQGLASFLRVLILYTP
jgi:hypothetical protein